MAFDKVTANAGTGGEHFAFDQFTDTDSQLKTMPYTAIAVGPLNGPYEPSQPATPLPVDPDAAASPQGSTATSVSLSVLGSVDLDSSQIASGKTGKLRSVVVWSARPYKAVLSTVSNGIATMRAIGGNLGCIPWEPPLPGRDYIQVAQDAGAGLDGFRVTVTNLDPSKATDVHATFFWDEVVT